MKALTLWQPWASMIPMLWKKIETRGWSTRYRGALAIHAAKALPEFSEYEPLQETLTECFKLPKSQVLHALCKVQQLPRGGVVAIATLKDVVRVETVRDKLEPIERALGNYSDGRYAWILDNITPAKKLIPARGAQQLWDWLDASDAAIDLLDDYVDTVEGL